MPLAEEEETADLRQILRALPRIPFYKFESDDLPAIVRVARRDKKTYLYVANEFAEPIQITVQLTCPPGTTCRPLGPSRPVGIEPADGAASRLPVALEGYGLAAWEIDHEDVRVQGLQTELPASAIASLKAPGPTIRAIGGHPLRESSQIRTRPDQPRTSPIALHSRPDSIRRTARNRNPSRTNRRSPAPPTGRLIATVHAWIDVRQRRTHRRSPLSADDLHQLAKISLEITLAWEERRFAECQRLLDSYWGRYLLMDAERPTKRNFISRSARSDQAGLPTDAADACPPFGMWCKRVIADARPECLPGSGSDLGSRHLVNVALAQSIGEKGHVQSVGLMPCTSEC